MTTYSFNHSDSLKYKTYLTQEMLKKGFLASTNFYPCIEHRDIHLDMYLDALDSIYDIISKCQLDTLKIDELLDGPVSHSGFNRLN